MSLSLRVLVLLLALPASAHVGDLFGGMDMMAPSDGPGLGVDASFGLLWSDDGDRFDWICHEAILSPQAFESPTYLRTPQGTLLGVVGSEAVAREAGRPVYRSEDGCDWQAVQGLDGQRLSGLDAEGELAVAITGALDTPNSLLQSVDDGRTWSWVESLEPTWLFRSVDIVQDGTIWATSARLEPNQGQVLRWMPDGSRSSILHDLTGDDARKVSLDLAVALDPERAWLVQGPVGGPDVLHFTQDGGATLEPRLTAPLDIIDVALDDRGTLWVVLNDGRLLRSVDGQTFDEPEGAPNAVGVDAAQGRVHVATRDSLRDGELAVSDDGENWTQRPVLDSIDGPLACPADTHAGRACPALWEETLERLVQGNTDAPGTDEPADPPETGGCSSTSGPGVWLLAVLALLIAPRRR